MSSSDSEYEAELCVPGSVATSDSEGSFEKISDKYSNGSYVSSNYSPEPRCTTALPFKTDAESGCEQSNGNHTTPHHFAGPGRSGYAPKTAGAEPARLEKIVCWADFAAALAAQKKCPSVEPNNIIPLRQEVPTPQRIVTSGRSVEQIANEAMKGPCLRSTKVSLQLDVTHQLLARDTNKSAKASTPNGASPKAASKEKPASIFTDWYAEMSKEIRKFIVDKFVSLKVPPTPAAIREREFFACARDWEVYFDSVSQKLAFVQKAIATTIECRSKLKTPEEWTRILTHELRNIAVDKLYMGTFPANEFFIRKDLPEKDTIRQKEEEKLYREANNLEHYLDLVQNKMCELEKEHELRERAKLAGQPRVIYFGASHITTRPELIQYHRTCHEVNKFREAAESLYKSLVRDADSYVHIFTEAAGLRTEVEQLGEEKQKLAEEREDLLASNAELMSTVVDLHKQLVQERGQRKALKRRLDEYVKRITQAMHSDGELEEEVQDAVEDDAMLTSSVSAVVKGSGIPNMEV